MTTLEVELIKLRVKKIFSKHIKAKKTQILQSKTYTEKQSTRTDKMQHTQNSDTFGPLTMWQKKTPDQHMKDFYDNHCVGFSMNGTYPLSCDTLDRADSRQQMLVLWHRSEADAKHLSYSDYKRRAIGGDKKQDGSEEEKRSQVTRFYVVFERLSRYSPLTIKNKRVLEEPYNHSIGTLSRSRTRLALPRFACGSLKRTGQADGERSKIDIFDCSKPEFWSSPETINSECREKICTLQLPADEGAFESLQFDLFARKVCVQTETALLIYGIPSDLMQPRGNIEEVTEEFEEKIVTSAYDRILSYQFEARADKWVVLQSRNDAKIQVIDFDQCPKTRRNSVVSVSREADRSDFNRNLFQSEDRNIELDISQGESDDTEDFWQKTSALFNEDGKFVIINTPKRTFKVYVDDLDDKKFLSYKELEDLQDKKFKCARMDNKIITYTEDINEQKLCFKPLKARDPLELVYTKLDLYENVKVLEAFKFTRDEGGNTVELLKVNAISSSEELLSWEVAQSKTEEEVGPQILKSANNPRASAFRFPFTATYQDEREVLLVSSAHKKNLIHYELQRVNPGNVISQMVFSQKANLYIMTETEQKERLVRLNVKLDFKNVDTQSTYSRVSREEPMRADHQETQEDLIFEHEKTDLSHKPKQKLFVSEQKTGNSIKVVIVQLRSNTLSYKVKHGNKECSANEVILPQEVIDVQQIDNLTFLVHEADQHSLRILSFEPKNSKNVLARSQIVYRNSSVEILRMRSDKDKIHLLLKVGHEVEHQTFKIKSDRAIECVGRVRDLQDQNENFIEAFMSMSHLNEDIIVQNDSTLKRIHADVNRGRIDGTIQSFQDYLPQAEDQYKDRLLCTSNMRNNLKRRKLLVPFIYPESLQAKRFYMCPYIADNFIETSKIEEKQTISWMEDTDDGKTLVYQYNLAENIMRCFDLSGQRLEQKSFKSEVFDGNKVLAIGGNVLIFLLTDRRNRFMKELELIRIKNDMTVRSLATIDTSKIMIRAGRQQTSFFDFVYCLKDKFDCTLNFSLNDMSRDILVTCKHKKSGLILAAIALFESQNGLYNASLLTTQEEQVKVYEDVIENMDVAQTPAQSQKRRDQVVNLGHYLRKVKNATISELKVILYSDYQIVHGVLKEIKASDGLHQYLLRDSKFEIFNRLQNQNTRGLQQDKIKSIHWCNKKEKLPKERKKLNRWRPRHLPNWIQSDQRGTEIEEEYEAVAIEVSTGRGQVLIVEYVLDQDKELGYLTASDKSVIFSQSGDQFMVATPDHGIINLSTKEIHLEYHVDQNNFGQLFDCDTEWGDQLYESCNGKFLIVPRKILLPYSLLSVVQHCQAEKHDDEIDLFYTSDYYKVDGSTLLHKFMENPRLLQKLLMDYLKQKPLFLTGALVKQEESKGYTGNNLAELTVFRAFSARNGTEQRITSPSSESPLDAQIRLKCDAIINLVLKGLTQIPMQYSFTQMKPLMSKICPSFRFGAYQEKWLVQTQQMEEIRTLYTVEDQGFHQKKADCSYLRKVWFERNQTEPKYVSVERAMNQAIHQTQTANMMQHNDGYVRLKDSKEVIAPDEERQQRRTDLSMMQVDWLTQKGSGGREFLDQLCDNHEKCIHLFKNKVMTQMVEFLWNGTRDYFMWFYFLPFLCLNFVPLVMMSFLMKKVEIHETNIGVSILYGTMIVLYLLGVFKLVFEELAELKNKGLKEYFYSKRQIQWENIIQVLTVIVSVWLVIKIALASKQINLDDEEQVAETVDALRTLMVTALELNLFEFFYKLRIFDFFASFVRQLQQIINKSLPLLSMLAAIVVTQTIIYWLLDQNADIFKYEGWPGFWLCFIDSYRYALGDFAITEYPEGDEEGVNMVRGFVFWTVFLLGTVMSLLILLNMVISIMGGAFEEINNNEEAEICMSKLKQILENLDRIPLGMIEELSDYKYMIVYEVEPESDPIGNVTFEERTEDSFRGIAETLGELQEEIRELREDATRNQIGEDDGDD